ncbi:DUF418 domain-containing protein [uncultured Cellulomonas sp.]|uniref:DUF418 domain-containing protein n=1 Tax=uncultured Cellulomonas sp. TaxID=189682 RepID=UPI00345B6A71
MIIVNVGPTTVEGVLERLYLFPYGRASILFVVVAGIGMGMFLRARPARGRRSLMLLWRAAVLLAGGLALQSLTDDVGVILPLYGLLFLSVLVLQFLPPVALITSAVTLAVVGPVLYLNHVATESVGAHSQLVQLGDTPVDVIHGLVVSGRYPLVTWAVPFVLGIWVAQTDLTNHTVIRRLLVWGAAATGVGLALSQAALALLGSAADEGYLRLLTGAAHGQMPLWLLSSCGGALFTIAVLLRLWPRVRRIARPLTAAGQLALTLYVLHVMVLAVIAPPADIQVSAGAILSAILITACLLLAVLWRQHFSIGPLEWVLRAAWLPWLHQSPAPRATTTQFTP